MSHHASNSLREEAPLGEAQEGERIQDAARALAIGELVILPTDTVYGVFCLAERVEKLRALRPEQPVPSTWHAPSSQAVLEVLRVRLPVHAHMVRTLSPGPVRFLVEQSEQTRAAILAEHQSLPSTQDPSGGGGLVWSVRVPDHPVCQRVLELVGTPVVADRVAGLEGLGDGTKLPAGDANFLSRVAARAGIARVLDVGPTKYGTGSTTIRLTRDGWWRFEGAGALSEGQVRARVETSVLFVCTGNTCRSPMAEAVARHMLARPGMTLRPTRIASAGVSAFDGDAMTPEARQALDGLGIKPAPTPHRASHLTRAMAESADVIYAMTASHARRIVELVPDAKDKVQLLDPGGRDIADPIGGTLADYRAAAEALAKFVEQRLMERGLVQVPQRRGILETW